MSLPKKSRPEVRVRSRTRSVEGPNPLLTAAIGASRAKRIHTSSDIILASLLRESKFQEVFMLLRTRKEIVEEAGEKHLPQEAHVKEALVQILLDHDKAVGATYTSKAEMITYCTYMREFFLMVGEAVMALEFEHDLILMRRNHNYLAWFEFGKRCTRHEMYERAVEAFDRAAELLRKNTPANEQDTSFDICMRQVARSQTLARSLLARQKREQEEEEGARGEHSVSADLARLHV